MLQNSPITQVSAALNTAQALHLTDRQTHLQEASKILYKAGLRKFIHINKG
jgi:hypothetical protein